jgi:hypothetical protein
VKENKDASVEILHCSIKKHNHIIQNSLLLPQQRAHMHNNPQRRALAQPRYDVPMRTRRTGPARQAHHAGADDEPDVRNKEVNRIQKANTEAAGVDECRGEKDATRRETLKRDNGRAAVHRIGKRACTAVENALDCRPVSRC